MLANLKASENSKLIKQLAKDAGFSFCGISKAEFLEEEASRLEGWLKNNYHGTMYWMEQHFDKRLNPQLLVPGATTVISLLYNYFPGQELSNQEFKISKYAYGEDYHVVIKDKLYQLVADIQKQTGTFGYRVFVDSAPVLERAWAAKSGLGWVGKNAMLINKTSGSYFFLAQIICDLQTEADGPIRDYCGNCTACIDACPTEAILPGKTIDSNRCISYLTIELRDEIPNEFADKMDNWVFGCDVCQDVCPWNRFSKPHNESKFNANKELESMDSKAWAELNEDGFKRIFKNSAVKRTKFKGLQRNIKFLKSKDI